MSDTADSDVETTDTSVENAADNGEASAESTDLALKDLSSDKEAEQSEAPVLATGDEGEAEITRTATDLEAVYDIPVQVSAVLGKADMEVSQLLKLGRGAVIELDRKVGEAIDIYVNDRLVARSEVVVVDDRLGITMTEIVKAERS